MAGLCRIHGDVRLQSGSPQSLHESLPRPGGTRLPIGFHAGITVTLHDADKPVRFHHAPSFVWCNVVHMTNWVMNGLPERFPNLPAV